MAAHSRSIDALCLSGAGGENPPVRSGDPNGLAPECRFPDPCLTFEHQRPQAPRFSCEESLDGDQLFLPSEDRVRGHDD